MTYELIFAVVVIGLLSREAIVWMLAGALVIGACRLTVAVLMAVWRLWRDYEIAAQVERDLADRRYLDTVHRTPAPFNQPAAQGFTRPPEIKR